jgi:hypothetical protein
MSKGREVGEEWSSHLMSAGRSFSKHEVLLKVFQCANQTPVPERARKRQSKPEDKEGSNARLNTNAGASEIVEEVRTLIVLYFIHIKQSSTHLTLLYTHVHTICLAFIHQSSKFRRFGLALAPGMNPPLSWPSWPVVTGTWFR